MVAPASSLAVVIFSLCLLHVSFFSDLYYAATTRFVGLRLFILVSGVYFCIFVYFIVGVVSRSFGVDAGAV